ncbi:MAG TPA: acyl-CoA dehydrogenase, partial [Nocardioides sp.]|nr:acyl-CoA dehydrogenase [Nocardioides sp.]
MDLTESPETPSIDDGAFRAEVRAWLDEHVPGADDPLAQPLAWNRHLAEHGWTCVGWPKEHG